MVVNVTAKLDGVNEMENRVLTDAEVLQLVKGFHGKPCPFSYYWEREDLDIIYDHHCAKTGLRLHVIDDDVYPPRILSNCLVMGISSLRGLQAKGYLI